MMSDYSGTRDEAPVAGQAARRLVASGMLQPLGGLLLAAGFVISLAGRHEGQLIRAERIHQEAIGR
ncbi:hypothetical protein GCM10010520_63260 [Rhizobium viscosum]|uniref:Uncharacterized protein n=1 Tax=Rhizobium viscosum TaxID=1673 RepID=A0ABR9IUW5_RHIVS|nr:hypothetical protein [Rhizobium viscosum]MBE1506986.1 hypothetical protein [Rhizobium viscosum]